MPVRIPTDASPQLQDALRGIEQRLAALEGRLPEQLPSIQQALAVVAAVETRLTALERGPAFGDEWLEMVAAGPQHTRGLTPDPAANAGLGTERVLHENGTWRRVLDGLIQAIPEGIGRPTRATRVLEVLADLAIAGSLGATTGDFKDVSVRGLMSVPLVGARVYHSTNQTYSQGATYNILFNSESFDTHGFHSVVSNTDRLTVPAGLGGYYLIGGSVFLSTSGSMTYHGRALLKGGSLYITDEVTIGLTTSDYSLVGPMLYRLAAGEYVVLQDSCGGSGTATVTYGTSHDYSPVLWMYRVAV